MKKNKKIVLDKSPETPIEVITDKSEIVSPVVISNDKEEIPKGFIATRPRNSINKNEKGTYQGRVYKIINNGYVMFCDNGQIMPLDKVRGV